MQGISILRGHVWHCRTTPTQHSFRYPLAYMQIPVSSKWDNSCWPLFGNVWCNVLSVNPRKHLTSFERNDLPSSLAQRVENAFVQSGIPCKPENVVWLTLPRLCGYTFEPVSFFLLFNSSQELEALICEVNNTFAETHCYVAAPTVISGHESDFSFPKSFYVSPFLSQSGTYHIKVRHSARELSIRVTLEQNETQVFEAGFEGVAHSLTHKNLLMTLAHVALGPWLVSTQISLHAAILFFAKKVKVLPKAWPQPLNGRAPDLWSMARYLIIRLWCRIQKSERF